MSWNCPVDNEDLTMLHMIVDKDGRFYLTIWVGMGSSWRVFDVIDLTVDIIDLTSGGWKSIKEWVVELERCPGSWNRVYWSWDARSERLRRSIFCIKKSLKLSTRTSTDSLASKGDDLCINIASMLWKSFFESITFGIRVGSVFVSGVFMVHFTF